MEIKANSRQGGSRAWELSQTGFIWRCGMAALWGTIERGKGGPSMEFHSEIIRKHQHMHMLFSGNPLPCFQDGFHK